MRVGAASAFSRVLAARAHSASTALVYTWLLGLVARQAGLRLYKGSGEPGQRVMLAFSVLVGTLQSLLFFALV